MRFKAVIRESRDDYRKYDLLQVIALRNMKV